MTERETRAEPIGGMRKSAWFNRVRRQLPEPVADVARSSARTIGTTTAALREMPDFLVVGAKKGGTTSVANWLVQHPQVMPMFPRVQRHKSPHYFDINYWRGPDWYLSHFPTRWARAARRRRTGGAAVGESSPYYLFHPAAPGRIRETAPDARLIAILREPVSRAHSNYWDRVVAGTEDLPTFEAAIEAEAGRTSGVTDAWLADPAHYDFDHDHHTYLARGHYAEQLRRYFAVFPREQLLVLPLEALKTDAAGAFRRIEDHLGLDHHPVDLSPRNAREANPKILPETRERLADYYAPWNAELRDLLGEDFGW
ncbi:sulfotransferase [Nocardioides coralli]|uniref:sulfotransferase n=1 Tax=Nocardioides coralli TaxID=2872154 RepID=UPI0020177FE0|nr:sulfotransferase [Nocardioides coralli]